MDDNELDKLFGMNDESSGNNKKSEDSEFMLDESKLEEELNKFAEDINEEKDEEPSATIIEEEEQKNTGNNEITKGPEEEPKPKKVKQPKAKKEKSQKKSLTDGVKEKRAKVNELPDVDFPVGKFIIALISLLLVAAFVCFLTLPQFKVLNVKIDGNIVLSDEEILNDAGIKANRHLMSGVSGNIIDYITLNYGKTEQKMKAGNPYYKNVKVSIRIPSTVHIQVEERAKVAYVRTPDGYVALDKDGIVIEMSSNLEDYKRVRPVICGLEMTNAVLGKKVKFKDEKDYQKAIIVLGAILTADANNTTSKYSMFAHTNEVRILPSGYIFLTLETPTGNSLQVKLYGVEKISEDMTWLLYAINVNAFDGLPDGALDMTDEEYIYRDYGFSRGTTETEPATDPTTEPEADADKDSETDPEA